MEPTCGLTLRRWLIPAIRIHVTKPLDNNGAPLPYLPFIKAALTNESTSTGHNHAQRRQAVWHNRQQWERDQEQAVCDRQAHRHRNSDRAAGRPARLREHRRAAGWCHVAGTIGERGAAARRQRIDRRRSHEHGDAHSVHSGKRLAACQRKRALDAVHRISGGTVITIFGTTVGFGPTQHWN